MNKMNLTVKNLHMDETKCTAANGSRLKMLGFIPVKLRVKDKEGEYHETNECLYFAEGVKTTLISLRALKNLECIPECFPLPAAEVFGLTDRDDLEEEVEDKVIPRQPTPTDPSSPPSRQPRRTSQG